MNDDLTLGTTSLQPLKGLSCIWIFEGRVNDDLHLASLDPLVQ